MRIAIASTRHVITRMTCSCTRLNPLLLSLSTLHITPAVPVCSIPFTSFHRYISAAATPPSSFSPSPTPTSSIGLSHVSSDGHLPCMVDVGEKNITQRIAVAETIVLLPDIITSIFDEERHEWNSSKGPVITTAIIAGTHAVKQTSTLIPFCHPLPIERIKFDITRVPATHQSASNVSIGHWCIRIRCEVGCTSRTGVEMESLTGCSIAALTIYDMLKALSHDIIISNTRLISKTGGKSNFTHMDTRVEGDPH
jgi:cyclic pyranopterin phosphate synthase